MTESDMYELRATEARREADAAILDNVRERCLRSEAAWRSMAEKSQQTVEHRKRNEAEKAVRAAPADVE